MCVTLFSLRLFHREVNIKSVEIPLLFVKKNCDGSCNRLFFRFKSLISQNYTSH